MHLWMKYLHSPPEIEDHIQQLLHQDRPHRLVGIAGREERGKEHEFSEPKLSFYPTLTKLFSNTNLVPMNQRPRLISFLGDTGSGKSTLIQNLIWNVEYSKAKDFGTPVVGGNPLISTSGGIHVYCDPETFRHTRPIVYAGKSNTRALRKFSNN